MELTLNENKMKKLVKSALIEVMSENREFFHEIIVEAMEDVGLVNAIKEGRKDKFVEEEQLTDSNKTGFNYGELMDSLKHINPGRKITRDEMNKR